jgi:predicted acetyltransferase
LDTLPTAPYEGYFLYKNATPIGFAIINISSTPHDVAEFYIIPSARRNGSGQIFAHHIFAKYPGSWQVRQISGADLAIKFWRKVISSFRDGKFTEEVVNDPEWGVVTKQSFRSHCCSDDYLCSY